MVLKHKISNNFVYRVLRTALTMSLGICVNQSAQDRYSTARVSKRLSYLTAACLRARYCTGIPNVACFDLGKNIVNSVLRTLKTKFSYVAFFLIEITGISVIQFNYKRWERVFRSTGFSLMRLS